MLRRPLAVALGQGRHVRFRSLLASIDQGTSSSRVILYDEALSPVASHQVELQSATTHPQPGWSQMDAKAIVGTVNIAAADLSAAFKLVV